MNGEGDMKIDGTVSFGTALRRAIIASLFAGLLAGPAWAWAGARPVFLDMGRDMSAVQPDRTIDQESAQERRDREQEARDREQERKDREQEKKDQEQERIDRMQELYEDGRESLDEGRYQQAEQKFDELARMNGSQADAALYWKAYAENQSGKRTAALATIADLKKRFVQSRWKKDAEALEIEIRNHSGQPVKTDNLEDDDLFSLAFQGLMNSNAAMGIQKAEQILNGSSTPKRKSKVLFVVAQSGSPEAQDLLGKIAQGHGNPELQRKAVEYLGIFGGNRAANTLAAVYTNTSDAGVKRAIIRSYMVSGNREQLFKLAKGEKDDGLKRDAIRNLGLVGGLNELQQLYESEPSTDVRREILQGFFLAGDSAKMVQAAQGEKDPELRRTAIRNLGLMGKSDVLQSIYTKETDRGSKEEVLNAYFISGNAKGLVAIAKMEKDPELKKRAVEKLSLMNSKEGSEYLMELLNK
jgi:hypothetical protein